jgi:hypothetical protein
VPDTGRKEKPMKNLETHIRSIVDHDGAIILNLKCDQFYSTNPVGAYI